MPKWQKPYMWNNSWFQNRCDMEFDQDHHEPIYLRGEVLMFKGSVDDIGTWVAYSICTRWRKCKDFRYGLPALLNTCKLWWIW